MTGIDPAALTSDVAVEALAHGLGSGPDRVWRHNAVYYRNGLASVAAALAAQGTGGEDGGDATTVTPPPTRVPAADRTAPSPVGGELDVFLVWGVNSSLGVDEHTVLSVHATRADAERIIDGIVERNGRFVAALLPEWAEVAFDQIHGPDRRPVLGSPSRVGDGDAREAQAQGPWRDGFERATLPTSVLFSVLDGLRLGAMYLDPPEDWKSHKFDPPEQYAREMMATWRDLLSAMRAAFDEIEAGAPGGVQDTPAGEVDGEPRLPDERGLLRAWALPRATDAEQDTLSVEEFVERHYPGGLNGFRRDHRAPAPASGEETTDA